MTEAVADHDLALDQLSVAELVTLMNERDATIPRAVRAALPAITTAIEATAERIRRGGRLIYVGAGTSGRLGILDAAEIPPTFGTNGDVVLGLIAGGPPAIISSVEYAEDSDEAGAARPRRLARARSTPSSGSPRAALPRTCSARCGWPPSAAR